MKLLNSVEDQMSGWKLRTPSIRLEQRLFGGRPSSKADKGWVGSFRAMTTRNSVLWGASVALLLLVANWNESEVGMARPQNAGFPVLAFVSNHSDHVIMAMHSNQTDPILGWTNGGEIISTSDSFEQLRTNYPLPKL